MNFREYLINTELDEGVVKVPPKLFNNMKDAIWSTILSTHFTKYNESEYIDSKFYKFIQKMNKKYKVKSQREKTKYYQQTFNYNIKGMGFNYAKLKTAQITLVILLGVVKKNDGSTLLKNTRGVYLNKDENPAQSVIINTSGTFLSKFPNIQDDLTLKTFKQTMNNLELALEHELMHSVQHNLLKIFDNSQVSRASNNEYPKASSEELYYLSNVEFDPQIVSALEVYNSLNHLSNLVNKKSKKEIFDNIVNSSSVSRNKAGYESLMFFKTLKTYDNKRWKIAVKKFRQLLINRYNIKL